jgi:mRNA-degrading endonuclease toxin of MazEF toxin-antitoxin module
MYNRGEVWFVEFPLEEDNSQTINRPVIVLDENILGVLSVKITKHAPRKEDPYDVPILYWQEANLRLSSTARVSKVILLSSDSFIFKIGELRQDDLDRIELMYQKYLNEND